MLETERVTCNLHRVVSTAQSLQMLFLHVMQKARKGSLGCVGQTAAEDFGSELEAAVEEKTRALELDGTGTLQVFDAIGRPCNSLHAMIWARMDTFGNTTLLCMGSLVVGDVE